MRYTTAQFGEETNLLGQFTAGRPAAQTFVTASPTTQFTVTTHPYTTGDGPHKVRSTTTLPSGLSSVTDYWIRSIDANTIQFHTSKSDAETNTSPVDGVDAGSGTHTIASAIQLTLVDIESDAAVTISDGDTVELTTTTGGGFSTYKWKMDKITSPATSTVEYEYIMEDRYTGAFTLGKVIVGGFTDESAIQRYQGAVWIDTTGAGSAGTAFPTGTPESPVDNIADALTIRSNFNLPKKLVLEGSLSSVTADLTSFEVFGSDPETHFIDFDVTSVLNDTQFNRLGIRGDLGSTGNIVANECIIGTTGGTVTRLRGLFLTCLFRGILRVRNGGTTLFLSAFGDTNTRVDYTDVSTTSTIAAAQTLGSWTIQNATTGAAISWSLASGSLTIASSFSAPSTVSVSGYGEFTNNGTITVLTDTVIRGTDIQRLLNSTTAKATIDVNTTPWQELRYVWDRTSATDGAIFERYDLYDQDGVAISGDASSGNNPLADATVMIAERRRV